MTRQKKQEEPVQHSAPNTPNPTCQDWSQVLPQLLRAGQGETILNLLPSAIHELNNAINTVLGFADLLQSEPSISKTLKEDLKAIESWSEGKGTSWGFEEFGERCAGATSTCAR